MKEMTKTTTSAIRDYGFKFVGNGGEYTAEAWGMFSGCDLPDTHEAWAEMMIDDDGTLYAVWAEDSLSCDYCNAAYIELDKVDHAVYYEVFRDEIEAKQNDKEEERERREYENRRHEAEAAKTEARIKKECDENDARRNRGEY